MYWKKEQSLGGATEMALIDLLNLIVNRFTHEDPIRLSLVPTLYSGPARCLRNWKSIAHNYTARIDIKTVWWGEMLSDLKSIIIT